MTAPRPRVLIADDVAEVRDILTRRLERLGAHATCTSDGLATLSALQSEQFDIVLLDLSMPGLSGIEVIQKLRATRRAWPDPTIIAISANAFDSRLVLEQLGVTVLLPKPIRNPDLAAVIAAATVAQPSTQQEM